MTCGEIVGAGADSPSGAIPGTLGAHGAPGRTRTSGQLIRSHLLRYATTIANRVCRMFAPFAHPVVRPGRACSHPLSSPLWGKCGETTIAGGGQCSHICSCGDVR